MLFYYLFYIMILYIILYIDMDYIYILYYSFRYTHITHIIYCAPPPVIQPKGFLVEGRL